MRIGFVSPFFHPAMIGGIEWYLYHVSRLLASRGHDVVVYSTDSDGKGGRLPPEGTVDGVRVERFPTIVDLTYRIKLWPGLAKALTDSEVDVLHVFDYAQFHNLIVSLSKKNASWSSVVSVYDIHSQIPRKRIKSLPMGVFDRYGARLALLTYDGILVRTPFQSDFLTRLGFGNERIFLAPPGIDPQNFDDPPSKEVEEVRTRYAPRDEWILLYVGRIHPIKGIDVLIRATSLLLKEGIPVTTLIVGPPSSDPYLSRLKDLARALGVSETVKFLGYLDERQKWILQSACDVAVLPSSFEGFGQSLIQAMARRKPVIGTDAGGMPWVLEEGKAGLMVKYGDEKGLAEAISNLLKDDRMRESLSRRAQERALEFSYPRLVEDLERIYASIGRSNRT